MANKKEHYFETLRKHNVSEHMEKKGQFNYLSWAYAVEELRKLKPDATWRVIKDENGHPYTSTPAGHFVEVEVTVDEISLSQIHPVLDNRNQPIEKPNAFQMNTSLQRALAKACALHGLGLHIYAGEDLPITENEELSKEFERIKGLLDEQETNVTLAKVWKSNQKTINELNSQQVSELQNYYKKKLNSIKAA